MYVIYDKRRKAEKNGRVEKWQSGDAFGERAVVVLGFGTGVIECGEEGFCADKEACIDSIVVGDFFADVGDFSVLHEDFCGVVHVEDFVEFVVDAEDGAVFWWYGGCGVFEHFGVEDVVGHGEDEVAADSFFSG